MLRFVVLGALVGALVSAAYVLTPPLRTIPPSELQEYAASRYLSEPAQAGRAAFGDQCSACHGISGEGTADAPGLTGRGYARDFRDAEAFHKAVGQAGQAHRQVLSASNTQASSQFNDLELMGKFLREMRKRQLEEAG